MRINMLLVYWIILKGLCFKIVKIILLPLMIYVNAIQQMVPIHSRFEILSL